MFYCSRCAERRSWPESIYKSYGRCEICGKRRECNDRSAATLPMPDHFKKEKTNGKEAV